MDVKLGETGMREGGKIVRPGKRLREKIELVNMTEVNIIRNSLRVLWKRQLVAVRLRWDKIWDGMGDGVISPNFGSN